MSSVVHFEIHASDPEALAGFYAEVFDWRIRAIPELDYWLIETGADRGIGGGMVRRRGERPPEAGAVNAFVCSVSVESAKASLDRALAAGATLALDLRPIPGVGYQAYVKDPDGNILGLHQSDPAAR